MSITNPKENQMSRKTDVNIIIAAAKAQYETIRKDYEHALREQSLDLRVPVKNLMENLRSSLDYIAHDIYESCCQAPRASSGKSRPRNVYFPYGRTEADFKSSVASSLPNLAINNAEIYDLVASIQPFRCADAWLYNFCSILNEKKHDKLKGQVRLETETYTVESEHGSVSIIVNNPNVKISSMPGAVKIFDIPAEFTDDGIKTAPSDRLTHKRRKWVAFTFEGSDVNVIGLLDKAVVGITNLANQIYTKI
jgi:hypothetical protein